MADGELQFFVDQPANWEGISRCLIVRGWCFARSGAEITGIRLRVTDLVYEGVTGLPRPDVPAVFPRAPHAHTGFEIRGILPAGTTTAAIEVQLAHARWETMLQISPQAKRQWLPLWLGGGSWAELMYFQMPGHMRHAPAPIRQEQFPPAGKRRSRPRIAVVTPSFQQARFLRETMRSVVEQRGVEIDYVVQDGGSTDGSVAIIQEFRPKLFAAVSSRDDGQADAIRRGFGATQGDPDDLMAWINSDDFYLPGAFEFVADYFASHPDVDVVYGHRIVVDAQSREIARWFLPAHEEAVLKLNDFVPQETLFWRRRLWDKVGGIDPAFRFAMDWDLLLRFAAAGAKFARVPYFLACFRVHPAQKTSAVMHDIGQREIGALRARAQGREVPPAELEGNPVLLRYLRSSAWLEFLWRWGIRGR